MKQKELQYRTNIVQEHYLQYRLLFFFSRTRFLLLQEYYMKLDVREAHEKGLGLWLLLSSDYIKFKKIPRSTKLPSNHPRKQQTAMDFKLLGELSLHKMME